MFDNYVWSDKKICHVIENGITKGFTLKTLITYYRGIPLSMIEDFQVIVDAVAVPREKIKFSPNDGEDWFSLAEMTTVTSYRWEYGEEGTIFVQWEGGLPAGEHEITVRQVTRVAYIPVPFGGERTAKVLV